MTLFTPEFLQTQTYSALRDRLSVQHGGAVQAGVFGATDFKGTQRAAGANMSLDVAAGYALVNANNAGNAGVYHVQNDAIINVPQPVPASATNPRIDQLFLDVSDITHGGDATDIPNLLWQTGTPTAGATLDNRSGTVALPANTLRIADVLVPINATTMTTANTRDRRPWALGAYNTIIRYNNAAAGSDYTVTTNTGALLVDGTNLQPRIECSGGPLRMTLRGRVGHSVSGGRIWFEPLQDGGQVFTGSLSGEFATIAQAAGSEQGIAWTWDWTPAAGSHLIGPGWRTDQVTGTLYARTTSFAVSLTIEEIVRVNANNN